MNFKLYTSPYYKIGNAVFFCIKNAIAFTFLVTTTAGFSQTELIKDINIESNPGANSWPSGFFIVDDLAFFRADDGKHGYELWVTDGSEEGTQLLLDITDGFESTSVGNLTELDGSLYFTVYQSDASQLWVSDGTPSGTSLITTISQPSINRLTAFDGALYFAIGASQELWKSDGTEGGTIKFGTLNSVSGIGISNNKLFIGGSDPNGNQGVELWSTDGTEGGFQLIKDINVGAGNSYPFSLIDVSGTLFFIAENGSTGHELWKSDGTEIGTKLVKDVNGTSATSTYQHLTNYEGSLYFVSNDGVNGQELWKSDGTSEGTSMILDANLTGSSSPQYLTVANGSLYFLAYVSNEIGSQLFISDGTSEGTVRFTGNSPEGFNASSGIVEVNSNLFFTGFTSGPSANSIWITDGTEEGTQAITSIEDLASIQYLTAFKSDLIFSAGGETGIELWISDGTAEGTSLLKDIKDGTSGALQSLRGKSLVVDDLFFFPAHDGDFVKDLWRTDGTMDGTEKLQELTADVHGNLLTIDGTTYFMAGFAELWKTDGTPEGTVLVKDINPSASYALSLPYMRELNGNLLFVASENDNNAELWISDGTEEGTVMVTEINETGSSSPRGLTELNGEFLFSAFSTDYGLWKTDGTSEGTTEIKNLSNIDTDWVVMDGVLYFSANDEISGRELWKSDGTPEGTVMVKDINEGAGHSSIDNMVIADGYIVFDANDGVNGTGLWKSDGTAEGTSLIYAGLETSNLTEVFYNPLDGYIYFNGYNPFTFAPVLWQTDGTEEGTSLLFDDESYGSGPKNFISYDEELFFSSGTALYWTDGTTDGTRGVTLDGTVLDLIRFNDILLAVVNSGLYGTELFKITSKDQTIIFESIENKIYGDDPFELIAASSEELPLNYESSNETIASIEGNVVTIHKAGEVSITARQQGSGVISSAETNRSLIINKRDLSILIDDATRTYGEQNPNFTFSYSNFVSGDTSEDLDESPTLGTDATQNSDVGAYDIFVAGGEDNNYNFQPVNGSLTITQANAEITLSNLTQRFNGRPRQPTVTTEPSGLNYQILYDGDEDPPRFPGSYEINVTIDELNYTGSTEGMFTISRILGLASQADITIYPNPVSSFLKSTIGGKFEIIGLDGVKLFRADIIPNNPIDLSFLTDGQYIIQIKDEDKILYRGSLIKR